MAVVGVDDSSPELTVSS